MRDYIYLGTYHVFRWLVTHTPEKILFPILKAIARFVYLVDRKHRRIARVNLDLSFGDEMSDEEKERIVKKTYENLVFNLAHFIAHQEETPEELMRNVTIENENYLEEALKEGKPVIFITAHYGNWELLPKIFATAFGPITVVGRPLDSEAMNTLLEENRKKYGIELLSKKGAMKGMISALRKGRFIGLLVDQNVGRGQGVFVDFFGKPVRHTPAAALLARRFDIKIIPTFIHSDDHKHFTVTLHPPLLVKKSDDIDADILENVQKQAHAVEEAIRRKPDEWFWLHRRWKARYKELYERSGAA